MRIIGCAFFVVVFQNSISAPCRGLHWLKPSSKLHSLCLFVTWKYWKIMDHLLF